MSSIGATGWVRDDAAVDATTVSLTAEYGQSCVVGDRPALKGYARQQIARGATGVFPWLSERNLYGAFKKAFFQARGSCVGQGTARAIQDAWTVALVQRGEVGVPAEVSVEAIYAGARVQIGGGRIRGDGAIGAEAAMFVRKFGAPKRAVYGQYDLTKPREDLAVLWGERGRGVPQIVLDAGKDIKIECYRAMTGEDVMDAGWAEHPMALCAAHTFGQKDRDGISRLNAPAMHCTELLGGFLTAAGNPGVGGQQSWGPNRPSGPSKLRYKGGEVDLREGMCGVPIEDIDRALRAGGECWAFQIVHGRGYRQK